MRETIKRGTAIRWMTNLAQSVDTDDCVSWPFKPKYTNGYGKAWFNKAPMGAHRAMCIIVNGEAPAGFECAHSCGNRICVNPRHLRWATPSENARDKIAHGTCARSKLTEDSVRQILSLLSRGKKQREIAILAETSRTNVSNISRGLTWKHIPRSAAQ